MPLSANETRLDSCCCASSTLLLLVEVATSGHKSSARLFTYEGVSFSCRLDCDDGEATKRCAMLTSRSEVARLASSLVSNACTCCRLPPSMVNTPLGDELSAAQTLLLLLGRLCATSNSCSDKSNTNWQASGMRRVIICVVVCCVACVCLCVCGSFDCL